MLRCLGLDAARDLLERLLAPSTSSGSIGISTNPRSPPCSRPRRDVSLVDRVSFEVMRRRRIDGAFAFDRDFADHGFTTIP